MTQAAKARAARLSLPFDLSTEYVYGLLSRGRCAVTGIPWDFSGGYSAHRPWCPSLDRIDPAKGYVRGNVQALCWAANRAKADLDHHDFKRLCRALANPEDRCLKSIST